MDIIGKDLRDEQGKDNEELYEMKEEIVLADYIESMGDSKDDSKDDILEVEHMKCRNIGILALSAIIAGILLYADFSKAGNFMDSGYNIDMVGFVDFANCSRGGTSEQVINIDSYNVNFEESGCYADSSKNVVHTINETNGDSYICVYPVDPLVLSKEQISKMNSGNTIKYKAATQSNIDLFERLIDYFYLDDVDNILSVYNQIISGIGGNTIWYQADTRSLTDSPRDGEVIKIERGKGVYWGKVISGKRNDEVGKQLIIVNGQYPHYYWGAWFNDYPNGYGHYFFYDYGGIYVHHIGNFNNGLEDGPMMINYFFTVNGSHYLNAMYYSCTNGVYNITYDSEGNGIIASQGDTVFSIPAKDIGKVGAYVRGFADMP